MTRQNIAIGSTANDGTGDTLRAAGTKINENFVEVYRRLGGDSNTLSTQITLEDSSIVFEGSASDAHETRLAVVNPTADRLVQLPDGSGVVVLDASTNTLTNKTLTEPTIYRPIIQQSINDSNGNILINLTSTASAVNNITITNQSTTNTPSIGASGDSANLNLDITGKGTGSVDIQKIALSSVEMTATGTVSQTASYIIFNGSLAIAAALGDGTTTGEMKFFTNKGSLAVTVTPTNFAGGVSFALGQNEAAQCIWDGSNWFLTGNSSILTITV